MGFASMFENIEEKLLANALEAARAKRLVESDLARLEDSLRSAIDRVVTPLMEVLTEPQVDLAREILELRECKLSLARDLEVVGKNNQRLERELASAHRHNRQLKEIVTQLRQRRAYGRLASR